MSMENDDRLKMMTSSGRLKLAWRRRQHENQPEFTNTNFAEPLMDC